MYSKIDAFRVELCIETLCSRFLNRARSIYWKGRGKKKKYKTARAHWNGKRKKGIRIYNFRLERPAMV